uniref:ATP synthase complex subunit 8 n=1 Tax=Attagenus augustatus augustatus TaxID=2783534 RepID=A0A7S6ZPV3_9COLE|nr:ATP synthase F0 subunit 8 [Attagenus augustatus augustatus]
MPQMAPMNWVTLFMLFSIILMLVNSINFFCLTYQSKKSNKNKMINKTNWKW